MAIGFAFLMLATESNAQTVQDIEGNGSFETAQLIQANSQTLEGAATGNQPNTYVVDASVGNSESDFFRVYLEAGEQYLTLNGDRVEYWMQLLLSGLHIRWRWSI